MAEWSIAAVLKTVELRGSGGSNPSLSAKKERSSIKELLFFFEKAQGLLISHYVAQTIISPFPDGGSYLGRASNDTRKLIALANPSLISCVGSLVSPLLFDKGAFCSPNCKAFILL